MQIDVIVIDVVVVAMVVEVVTVVKVNSCLYCYIRSLLLN